MSPDEPRGPEAALRRLELLREQALAISTLSQQLLGEARELLAGPPGAGEPGGSRATFDAS